MNFQKQKGAGLFTLIIGLLIGLAIALIIAVFVNKVPNPFNSHMQDDSQVEAEKNKNWDPNASLYGKNPAKPADPLINLPSPPPASENVDEFGNIIPPAITTPQPELAQPTMPTPKPKIKPKNPSETPDEVQSTEPKVTPTHKPKKPNTSDDPLGDLARAQTATDNPPATSSNGGSEPFIYFVQAGAFRDANGAESLRAKLTLSGLDANLSEREQAGRTIYRVRLGPYDSREGAERALGKLSTHGIDGALVRVQR